MSLGEAAEPLPARERTAGVVLSVRDRIFCLTSSVVKGAPVLRIAVDEAVEDSVDELESELAERADFLWLASEGLLVAAAAVLLAAVFLCVCWRELTDSSVSSVLDTAWRKQCVRF